MNKDNGKIKLEIKRSTIREATEMGNMMMSSGALYEEHPITKLLNEILDEASNTIKKKINNLDRKH